MIFFSLYNSCVLTKGIKRCCLIDLERAIYCPIPVELYDALRETKNISISSIKDSYCNEDVEIIGQYLTFLQKNKFIYSHLEKNNVTSISKESFESPYNIEDLIIDIDTVFEFDSILSYIPKNIETLQLRFFGSPTIIELDVIVDKLRKKGVVNIELVLNHSKYNDSHQYTELFNTNKIISKIFILGYGFNAHLIENKVIGFEKRLVSIKECGKITEKFFFPNLRTYSTSQSCNSCLNRKISIDKDGNIKNCPSMAQSFGNIKDTTLEEALNHPDFKKYWNVTKDQIEVCKDCEFRYICTDCRAYTERTHFEEDIDLSKPLKCGYNPYTNEWAEWSTNPLKQQAIEYYGMQELVKLPDVK